MPQRHMGKGPKYTPRKSHWGARSPTLLSAERVEITCDATEKLVEPRGIEPRSQACKACVLPLYRWPLSRYSKLVADSGLAHGPSAYETDMHSYTFPQYRLLSAHKYIRHFPKVKPHLFFYPLTPY